MKGQDNNQYEQIRTEAERRNSEKRGITQERKERYLISTGTIMFSRDIEVLGSNEEEGILVGKIAAPG